MTPHQGVGGGQAIEACIDSQHSSPMLIMLNFRMLIFWVVFWLMEKLTAQTSLKSLRFTRKFGYHLQRLLHNALG